jgi:hypothetical protein
MTHRHLSFLSVFFVLSKLPHESAQVFDAAQAVTAAIDDARPLLQQAVRLSEEVLPLLQELRQGPLVKNIESLSTTAAEMAADIHK